MARDITSFRDTYNKEAQRLGFPPADEKTIKCEYEKYETFVDFFGRDGKLDFEKDDTGQMTWTFDPHAVCA